MSRTRPLAFSFAAAALCAAPCGCGTTPPPQDGPPPTTTVVAPVLVAEAPTTTATAIPDVAVAPATPPIPMYPVVRIYSLFDVTATDDGLELSLGYDPGGGALGHFQYVPFVNGAPDFSQETAEVQHADSTMQGYMELLGKRPNLLLHIVSGFRSEPADYYQILDADGEWSAFKVSAAPGIGIGIQRWTKDRLLEWRAPLHSNQEEDDSTPRIPRLRVLTGADKAAPSVPASLEKRLKEEGFSVDTVRTLPSGELVAIGKLLKADGIGTLLWTDKLNDPKYAVTPSDVVGDTPELRFLGGDTLAALRLQANDKVLAWDGAAWKVESTVPEGALPDVWFGSPMLRYTDTSVLVRMEAGAPWRPVQRLTVGEYVSESFAIDRAGVLWKTEDNLLLSSKEPAAQLPDVTELDIVKRRKTLVLRGGSYDVTGAPPDGYPPRKCSMSYVLLDISTKTTDDPTDYARIRKHLQGHTELAKARFVVSKIKRGLLFGALLASEAEAEKLSNLMKKLQNGREAPVVCAEPEISREIKIDLATGQVVK